MTYPSDLGLKQRDRCLALLRRAAIAQEYGIAVNSHGGLNEDHPDLQECKRRGWLKRHRTGFLFRRQTRYLLTEKGKKLLNSEER